MRSTNLCLIVQINLCILSAWSIRPVRSNYLDTLVIEAFQYPLPGCPLRFYIKNSLLTRLQKPCL